MQKRWYAAVLACAILLTSCGTKPATPPALPTDSPQGSSPSQSVAPPSTSSSQTQPSPQIPVKDDALAAFRQEIAAKNATVAVAYLGYAELTDYADLTAYLEANGFYESYPILRDVTETQYVRQGGCELYVVVPAAQNIALAISHCDEEGHRGKELLQSENGQPVILQGNVSEVVPNLCITAVQGSASLLEYTPSLSLKDGSLSVESGVLDFTDYEHLADIQHTIQEDSVLCGIWYARSTDGDGYLREMRLALWPDGTANYSYGIPDSDILESFSGYWNDTDGLLKLEMKGGPVGYDGLAIPQQSYDMACTLEWDYQSRGLSLLQCDGTLLYGTEGAIFWFMPFNPYPLAGNWTAETQHRSWQYRLNLLENGECHFSIMDDGEAVAFYEGWWSMTANYQVSLGVGLNSGKHPESPELVFLQGLYSTERSGDDLTLKYVSGDILTLDMEEDTFEVFCREPEGSCVSIHYEKDLGLNPSDYDWVIVDETFPAVKAALCTMVPVTECKVVSLTLKDVGDSGQVTFDTEELFDYGTLIPERPLVVVLTIYGDIPTYGVSFVDPTGQKRLFGIAVSGMDGSLILTEIR